MQSIIYLSYDADIETADRLISVSLLQTVENACMTGAGDVGNGANVSTFIKADHLAQDCSLFATA